MVQSRNPHGITARQITGAQPMTTPLKPGWQFAHGLDLYASDAHLRARANVDFRLIRSKNRDVAAKLATLKRELKEIKSRNSAQKRDAKEGEVVKVEETWRHFEQIRKLGKRAGRLAGFLHWLRVGATAKPGTTPTKDFLVALIAEFYADPITRLGSIVRE